MKLSPTIPWHNDNKRFLAAIYIQTLKYGEAEKILDSISSEPRYLRPPFHQLAWHYISLAKSTNQPKLAIYWAKLGLKSIRITAKTGKKAYGPKSTYSSIEEKFLNIISEN